MNQLEQIEELTEQAQRRRVEAFNKIEGDTDQGIGHDGVCNRYIGEVHAYTQAATIARPLQEAVDAMRCNIWTLFALVDPLNEKAELSAREGAHFEATFYRARADATAQIATNLHCHLERAGLC